MKKFLALILCVLCIALPSVACQKPQDDKFTLACPDGAPAISAFAISSNENIDTTVYASSDAVGAITALMSAGEVDFAILPINVATKTEKSGYTMLGVLTHGNLYGISKTETNLEVNDLKGKKVGTIQIGAVPGFTIKSTLNNNGIQFVSSASELNANNVLISGLDANKDAIINALDNSIVDVAIVAEPMCSMITANANYKKCFALHDLYGSYPQAVLMVKNSVLANNTKVVKEVMKAFSNFAYENASGAEIVSFINANMNNGATSTLKPVALSSNAIAGSNIRFSLAKNEKQSVLNYISDLKSFNTALGTVVDDVDDSFFYGGDIN